MLALQKRFYLVFFGFVLHKMSKWKCAKDILFGVLGLCKFPKVVTILLYLSRNEVKFWNRLTCMLMLKGTTNISQGNVKSQINTNFF